MSFIKEIVTNVKLVTKIKKHEQLYLRTLVLASRCYYRVNSLIKYGLQNTSFRETNNINQAAKQR